MRLLGAQADKTRLANVARREIEKNERTKAEIFPIGADRVVAVVLRARGPNSEHHRRVVREAMKNVAERRNACRSSGARARDSPNLRSPAAAKITSAQLPHINVAPPAANAWQRTAGDLGEREPFKCRKRRRLRLHQPRDRATTKQSTKQRAAFLRRLQHAASHNANSLRGQHSEQKNSKQPKQRRLANVNAKHALARRLFKRLASRLLQLLRAVGQQSRFHAANLHHHKYDNDEQNHFGIGV